MYVIFSFKLLFPPLHTHLLFSHLSFRSSTLIEPSSVI